MNQPFQNRRQSSGRWFSGSFITLMVIPERTRRVHRLVIPFFALRVGIVLFGLIGLFLVIMGVDYIHVLGRMAENKRLKGENFKLRQEMQVIKNKVDAMESTVERVRNYAKKLQILTGQGDKGGVDLPTGGVDLDLDRTPASKEDRHSAIPFTPDTVVGSNALGNRVERLQKVGLFTETEMSRLQGYLVSRSALIAATPSLLPINGWLSSPFGRRMHPLEGVYRMHTGVDLAAEPGTPVRAPADGTIMFSGYREGYGKVVVINHGYGITTVMGHNSKLFVTTGMRVKRGEKISEVGSTGMSTGPHLHYEIRKNGIPVNPTTFLSRARF